jgi:transposase
MAKTFRDWDVEQGWLLPPSVMDFVPADHLAHFVRDVVRESLDLSAILDEYTEERGYPPYHPTMMTALLLYAYCQGTYSSRKIAKGCVERVDFMAVTGLNRPDFRTISDFRKRHLKALSGLFVQVLKLCRGAGLTRLGHVALDGTKVKANASKHKSMSYERLLKKEIELKAEVAEWFKKAQAVDAEEDRQESRSGNADLPEWVANKQRRLEKIREAKVVLESEAQARGEAIPKPKDQYNFTDPQSRIMKGSDSFVQAYNAQAIVDADSQVIVAQDLNARPTDVQNLAPLIPQIRTNLSRQAQELSADTGYCSEGNLAVLAKHKIRAYIATGKQKHGKSRIEGRGRGPRTVAMRRRLQRAGYRSRYRLRKQTVEPVFGQIKQARGFRQFLLRGLEKTRAEWSLICTVHNLLKLAKRQLPS